MSSCKKDINGGSSAALEIIPADAAFIISVDYETLVKKGKLNNLDNYAFMQKLTERIVDGALESTRELILNFVKDQSSLGLNPHTCYIFGLPSRQDGDKSLNVFAVFNITKQSVLEENVRKIDKSIKIEDSGVFKKAKRGEGSDLPFAWNKEVAIISFKEIFYDDFDSLFEKKTSITNDESFSEFLGKRGDFKIWFKYCNLFDLSEKFDVTPAERQFLTDIFGKINNLISINFENGNIRFDCKAFPKSEVNRVNEKYPVWKDDFNDELLGDFPEETFMLFKFAVNVKDCIRLLNELKMFDSRNHSPFDDPEVQRIANALAGDFVIDVEGFADGFMPVPLVSFGFTVTDRQGFENILSLIPSKNLSKSGDVYMVTVPGIPIISIFIAEKDNRVIVSNNQKHIEAFSGRGLDKSLKSSELLAKHKNSVNFSYINLNFNTYPLSIRGLLNNISKNSENITTILNRLHSYTSWQEDKYTFGGSLKFTDVSTNSLQILLEIIDDISTMVD
ncbi:MAG: DUF4836 family protein [Dysgonamonadaceae bacterium]|nr:DUF4836 family protein [Dysgonamonadaceae bacterium]